MPSVDLSKPSQVLSASHLLPLVRFPEVFSIVSLHPIQQSGVGHLSLHVHDLQRCVHAVCGGIHAMLAAARKGRVARR